MPAIETAAAALAKTVASRVAMQWLAYRRDRDGSSRELSDVVALRFPDRFLRRKIDLQLQGVTAEIAERIERSFGSDGLLPANESAAALDVVSRTFGPNARTDDSLFAVDADPDALVASLRPALRANADAAGLSEGAVRLAEIVLADCVRCHVEMVRHLPEFNNRASQEMLTRLTQIAAEVSKLLSRLPAAGLTEDTQNDDESEAVERYLRFVSTHHDQLELFGVDVRNYTPETTLSIAYLSLAVTDAHAAVRTQAAKGMRSGARGSFVQSANDEDGDGQTGLRVEAALGQAERILIRGEAGSGKSTLLRWLAIRAARREFTGDLAPWNGRIPFLIKLRSYADKTFPAVGNHLGDDLSQLSFGSHTGWVERIFAEKKALLLVDGVDELVRGQRAGVREWLRRILNQYPDAIVVVTSRPTAAPARWLTSEGFATLLLERMTPVDIVVFVQRWHRAISGTRHLPCGVSELPRYQRRLLARLDGNHHLRGLATNPLMCAMLCALNLDRADDLPHDRLNLYRAALEMLLERRDAARNVPAYRRVALGSQHAMSLLQDVAWRLTIAGHAELDTEQAKGHIARKLATMPKVTADAADVFEHLLDRSGVLKDVAEDRLSFVHRTFQEYLTAKEIAEENYIDVLIEHANRDMWRETVIMTAGLASSEYRQHLIGGLLDRADVADPRKARWLRLLASACVETAPALHPSTLERIDKNLALLVPPRSAVEARSLALAGERVIDLLPDELTALTDSAARAVINTAAFVGGPRALHKLARYGATDRQAALVALVNVASYFEPDEYGRAVLAESPLRGIWVTVDDWTVSILPHLRHIDSVALQVDDPAGVLRTLQQVRRLQLQGSPRSFASPTDGLDMGFLAELPALRHLGLYDNLRPESFPTLAGLTALSIRLRSLADISWLSKVPNLESLSLDLGVPQDFRPLTALRRLTSLTITALPGSTDLVHTEFVRHLAALEQLSLNGFGDPNLLNHIADAHASLRWLQLMRLDIPNPDLSLIARMPLIHLDLDSCSGFLIWRRWLVTRTCGASTFETANCVTCHHWPQCRISAVSTCTGCVRPKWILLRSLAYAN